MENKAEEILSHFFEVWGDTDIDFVNKKLQEYASQQKPETIKSDNSKVNAKLLEALNKLLEYGDKQVEIYRQSVDDIKSDQGKTEDVKIFQMRLSQGKFYGWRDSMKFLRETIQQSEGTIKEDNEFTEWLENGFIYIPKFDSYFAERKDGSIDFKSPMTKSHLYKIFTKK